MYLAVPPQPDCVSAWRQALRLVDAQPGHEAYNVIIDVANPVGRSTMADPVVAAASAFLESHGEKPIETIAMASFNYRIYPNPAQESINFEIATEQAAKAEFTIFNAQGSIQKQMYYTVNEGNQVFEVKCSDWSPGLYFVRMQVNEDVKTEKVIINR